MISGFRNSYIVYDIKTGKVEKIPRSQDKHEKNKKSDIIIDVEYTDESNLESFDNQIEEKFYIYNKNASLVEVSSQKSKQITIA